MKIDDVPPYTDVLGKLAELRDAASVARSKAGDGGRCSSPQLLKSILDGIFDRMEAHAMSKGVGIAWMIYTEISGHAGLRVFQRLDAMCLQTRRAEPRAPLSALSAGRSSRRGGPRGGSAAHVGVLSAVRCFECQEMGHIKSNCPNRKKSKPS